MFLRLLLLRSAYNVVEPPLLLLLGIGQIEHQRVEHVGVAHQEAEVVIGSGSLLGELAAGAVGEEVGLSNAHLLLLLWSGVDGLSGSLGVGCSSGESHCGRHFGYVLLVFALSHYGGYSLAGVG